MKKIVISLFLLMIFGFLMGYDTPASFGCDERTVDIGDTRAEVIRKCGEPTSKDVWEEEYIKVIDTYTLRRLFITIDEWTYNLGPNKFIRILKFRNGKLIQMKTGDYGY